MEEQKERITVVNPYVFPGLKVTEKEKTNILSTTIHGRYGINKEDLLEIISQETGITISEIMSRSRKREKINARFIYCAILKNNFGYTLTRIGELLDCRDHTSIRHAVQQYNNRLHTEESFRITVSNILNKIRYKTK